MTVWKAHSHSFLFQDSTMLGHLQRCTLNRYKYSECVYDIYKKLCEQRNIVLSTVAKRAKTIQKDLKTLKMADTVSQRIFNRY